jgi:hypothetical protein
MITARVDFLNSSHRLRVGNSTQMGNAQVNCVTDTPQPLKLPSINVEVRLGLALGNWSLSSILMFTLTLIYRCRR